ncbi:hypothetical protein EVAR_86404_1 [Eumeta japonica]|uniref:Uncharacterized protein n=1 Tax=Eumeta variegata TaxID=151549 RepID=A0A4C1WBG5_EUMVA|nr:hypothetical protein EVAR_86404_1 [Eumeta japonica]
MRILVIYYVNDYTHIFDVTTIIAAGGLNSVYYALKCGIIKGVRLSAGGGGPGDRSAAARTFRAVCLYVLARALSHGRMLFSIMIFTTFFRRKRAYEPLENRLSPPPTDTRNPTGVTIALSVSWIVIGYLIQGSGDD